MARVSDVSAETRTPTQARAINIRSRYRKNPSQAVPPAEPWGARRADALARVAESWLVHGPEGSLRDGRLAATSSDRLRRPYNSQSIGSQDRMRTTPRSQAVVPGSVS